MYKCYDLEKDMFVAMKFSSTSGLSERVFSDCLKHINREYMIHKELDHRNIAKVELSIEMPDANVTIMEFCDGPELSSYLKAHCRI